MPDPSELLGPEPEKKLTPETIAGLRITSPEEYQWLNMLVYGDPGVGKTRLAGSAVLVPEMCPVLLMDFEGGTLSLAGDMREIDVVRLTSWEKVDRLYGSLYDINPYKTVVIDSLSELQKFSMSEIMRAVVQKDASRDADIASLREWGKNGEQVRRFVRAFRDLPCNTIFTALANEDRDEHTGMTKLRPALPGKMKGEVAGYVDIVLYMYLKETGPAREREIKTLVLTQGTERQVAKDRSGTLPALLEAPKMQNIYDHIRGGTRANQSD
jgi:phage nucleotide-binding protein